MGLTVDPSFKEVMAKAKSGSLFKNKQALSPHFVPETLLYREKEIRELMSATAPALQNQKPSNVFIYGKTGSGKTCVTKHVLQKLREEGSADVCSVYMNCRVYDSRYKVLQKTITSFCPDFAKTGYSFAILYEKLLDWSEGDGKKDEAKPKQIILALDGKEWEEILPIIDPLRTTGCIFKVNDLVF